MIRPTQGRIVATPVDLAEVIENESGIILSAASGTMARYREYRLGKVIALPDGDTGEAGVVVGETIVWRKFTGIETQCDGEDIVILTEEEILGVVVDA